ncbi:MAG: group II intron maturase-specific domain-containing protein [Caldicoprobacterales bacterium]
MIAEMINPTVRGWLNYFTKYNPSAVRYTIDCLNSINATIIVSQ